MTGMRNHGSQGNAIAEKLWEVVREAIEAGISPTEFKEEVAACWEEVLRDMAKDAAKILRDK